MVPLSGRAMSFQVQPRNVDSERATIPGAFEARAKPNFFVVGAARAGTTSLYHYLRSHPAIFLSPVKEPNYFAKDVDTTEFLRQRWQRPVDIAVFLNDSEVFLSSEMTESAHSGHVTRWDDYLELFRNVRREVAIGECSVSYLVSKCAAAEIRAVIPDAKILMILRDPIERAYSHYIQDLEEGAVRGDFMQAVGQQARKAPVVWGIVETSLYYQQVKRYFDCFSSSQIKVFLYEDLKQPDQLAAEMFDFLGVDNAHKINTSARFNAGRMPRFRFINYLVRRARMHRVTKYAPGRLKDLVRDSYFRPRPKAASPADRALLRKVFRPDVLQLQELIRRDLSGWLA